MAALSYNDVAVFGFVTGLYFSLYSQYQTSQGKDDTVTKCYLLSLPVLATIHLINEPAKIATYGTFVILGFGIGNMYIPRHMILSLVNQGTRIE